MLPKSQRLNLASPENQEFYRAFRVITQPHLKVYWQTIHSKRTPQQAVVVGKKISLLAVVRNKIKRQVYQLLETSLQRQSVPSVDLVIVVTQQATAAEYHQDIITALAQL